MSTKSILLFLVVLLLIGGGAFLVANNNNTVNNTTPTMAPTPSTIQQNNDSEAVPTVGNTTPTIDAKHSGEGIVEYAHVEQGSGAQLVGVTGVGSFAVTNQTKIYDENNKEVTFSYLRKGQKVRVSGAPGEGYLQAFEIRVQK